VEDVCAQKCEMRTPRGNCRRNASRGNEQGEQKKERTRRNTKFSKSSNICTQPKEKKKTTPKKKKNHTTTQNKKEKTNPGMEGINRGLPWKRGKTSQETSLGKKKGAD